LIHHFPGATKHSPPTTAMPPRTAAPAVHDDGECADGLPTLEDVIKGFILPSGGVE
jgi:hypothetical protein